jgi:serine O-acetyltransferase
MMIFIYSIFSFFFFFTIIALIHKDIQAVFKGDPAARNIFEVYTYPGLYAITFHRIIHLLWVLKVPVIPRVLSQVVRFLTFIEIHPGAKIGSSFFIDHGDGVVIGETSIIGCHVILYHQVTLGGTGKEKGKRHPTIKNHVIVGAGSKILGNISIGNHCKVGAGSVVLKSVADHSTVVGNPARTVRSKNEHIMENLDLGNVPDIIGDNFRRLEKQIKTLKKELNSLSNPTK